MFLNAGISIILISLGPVILAVVMAAALNQRTSRQTGRQGDLRRARYIVAVAALATVLVTVGVLILRR